MSSMTAANRAADKYIRALEAADCKIAKLRKGVVTSRGYVVGVQAHDISIAYMEPEGGRQMFQAGPMHEMYLRVLSGQFPGLKMAVHDEKSRCTIHPAHLHIKV